MAIVTARDPHYVQDLIEGTLSEFEGRLRLPPLTTADAAAAVRPGIATKGLRLTPALFHVRRQSGMIGIGFC